MVNSASIPATPDTVAPDGSLIGLLAASERGSMVHCTLAAGAVSRPVQHRTVEELWFVVSGSGVLSLGGETLALRRGVSVAIPTGTAFQFRAGHAGLELVIATIPPWPGADEAEPAAGPWEPTAVD
jgi:mannose-6-phosphate isomerase-like protein (cupin superfamily)